MVMERKKLLKGMSTRVSKHVTNWFSVFSLVRILGVWSQAPRFQAYSKRKMLIHAAVTVRPALVWHFYAEFLVVYFSADGTDLTVKIVNISKQQKSCCSHGRPILSIAFVQQRQKP